MPSKKESELIRKRRQANALSQVEVAEKLSVSQGLISQWESGRSKPSDQQRNKLDEILGGILPTSDADAVTESESQTAIAAWLSKTLGAKGLTVGELAAKASVSIATVYNILSGRAQNPQKGTITALEKALDEHFESKNEDGAAQDIRGIGELIDFNPHEQSELPVKAGVYVLYDISQRPIYVGKANRISDRLQDHASRFWYKRRLVETAAYIEISDSLLRDQVETVLIQFLKNNAVINKQKTARG